MKNQNDPPPEKSIYNKIQIFKQFTSLLSNFISKELMDFTYNLTRLILLIEFILVALGIMEFNWQSIGITSVILLMIRSKDFKGIL